MLLCYALYIFDFVWFLWFGFAASIVEAAVSSVVVVGAVGPADLTVGGGGSTIAFVSTSVGSLFD